MNTEVPTNITATLNNILSNIRNQPKPIETTGSPDVLPPATEANSLSLCVEHERNPESEIDLKGNCPICREIQKKRRLAGMRQRFAAMQVGKRFHDCQWRDYQPVNPVAKANRDILKGFADNFASALERGTSGILLGNHGTGKNMLAALICKSLAQQGYSALHTTVARLIRRVRQTWRNGAGETEEEVLKSMSLPDLLVVDEVGVQAGTVNEQNILTEVINDRYEAMKPVLLISNLTFRELEELLGARIIDRFYEGGSFTLTFGWESYRRNGGTVVGIVADGEEKAVAKSKTNIGVLASGERQNGEKKG